MLVFVLYNVLCMSAGPQRIEVQQLYFELCHPHPPGGDITLVVWAMNLAFKLIFFFNP